MKKLFLIGTACLITACHGKPLSSSTSNITEFQVQESCSRSGFCHRCTGSGDSRSCGYGYSAFCPGSRLILEAQWTVTTKYEDGYVGVEERQEKIKNLTKCR